MTEPSPTQDKFKLYSVQDLDDFPKPAWLIDHVIEHRALGVLFGATKSGKSFLALDWALSIASGRPWHDRATKQGAVVYVVGEGVTGTPKRIAAWMRKNDVPNVADAFFVIDAPQVAHEGDLSALVSAFDKADVQPALIVFDTLARCFVGKDENSATDMGRLIEGCRWLQDETSATVLLLHHSGKSGDAERGSSALAAGADVMISIKREAKRLKVENTKQKNAAEFDRRYFQLEPVALNGDAPSLENSCVLIASEAPKASSGSPLGSVPVEALTALYDIEPAVRGPWLAALRALRDPKPVPEKTFANWRDRLVERGLVEKIDGRYELTLEGQKLLPEHSVPMVASTQVGV